MPLQPDPNRAYWPLLLTDGLYLLPQDLAQQVTPDSVPAPPVASTVQEAIEAQATPAGAPITAEAPQADLVWGSLAGDFLILVDYPNHPLLDRPDGLFLVEVLKAVGLDFKEVATLNISRCKTAADWTFVQQLSSSRILSFGVQHAQLPYTQNSLLYEAQNIENRLILLAEPLAAIRTDIGSKKKLWNLLKQALV